MIRKRLNAVRIHRAHFTVERRLRDTLEPEVRLKAHAVLMLVRHVVLGLVFNIAQHHPARFAVERRRRLWIRFLVIINQAGVSPFPLLWHDG